MATELPEEPKSRKESYLADIAGQDVELPDEPKSREEQYLAYIAENGGGGGGGGTSNFNQLTNRPKYNGTTMTGDTNIPEVKTYTAGSNITISGNQISATDTTYSAGTGLSLTGTEFSVDTSTIATQTDLSGKQNTLTAGSNITITGDTISATDTTYSNFTGTDGTAAGTAGLVPAPATTDAGKFLKADGTWDTAGGGSGPTVVQTTGTSTTDVMSQNAVTSMVFADPSTRYKVQIGDSAYAPGIGSAALTSSATARGQFSIALGPGSLADTSAQGGIALGAYSSATTKGQVDVSSSSTSYGYLNSNYRLLTGLYDGQSAHDAATKGQLDSIAIKNAGAPTTATVGTVGQLLEDTTNGKLYQCTAVDTTDPQNPSYTWTEVGAGGGGSGVIELTSADYNWNITAGNATTEPFDCVALWLLPVGLYYRTNGVVVKIAKASQAVTYGYDTFLVSEVSQASGGTNKEIVMFGNDGRVYAYSTNASTGAGNYGGELVNSSNLVQTTGTAQTDVMSQNAVTSMVFKDPSTRQKILIGAHASLSGNSPVAIGDGAKANNDNAIAIGGYGSNDQYANASGSTSIAIGGYSATASGDGSVAIGGYNATASGKGSIALGHNSSATVQGQMDIGTSSSAYGYNTSNYRLLTGLYDGQSAHDAATYGQMNTRLGGLTLVSISQTDYDNLQTYDSNTLYVITGA